MSKIMNNIMGLSFQMNKNGMNKKTISNLVKNVSDVKFVKDAKEFDKLFSEIMLLDKNNFSVIRNHYIVNNLFPDKIKKMKGYPTIRFSGDVCIELRWRCQLFKYYSGEISEFIKLRKEYDKNILLSEYEPALNILEKVLEKYGVSFWYLESLCFVYKKLGKDIKSIYENEKPSLNKTILSYYGLKNRENMTCSEYEQVVNREIKNISAIASEDVRLKELIPYFNYRIMPLTFIIDEGNISYLLKTSASDTLIDQYLLCLNIFDCAMDKNKASSIYRVAKDNIKLLSGIKDEHLKALRFVFDDNKCVYSINKQMNIAKNYFINNKLLECRDIVIKILSEEPYNIQALNLLVEVDILLKKQASEYEGTVLGELIYSLMSVYPMAKNRDEYIDVLFKYLNCCSQSEWANFISKTVNYRCSLIGTKEEVAERRNASVQCLDIETVCNCLDEKEAIEYIKQLDESDNYISFREAIVCHKYDSAEHMCKLDVLNVFMKICCSKYSLEEKREYIKSLREHGSTIELMMKDYYLSHIDMEKNLMEALEFATDTLIDNIFTSLFVPIQTIVEVIEKCEEEIWGNICIPILYYMRYRYYDRQTKSEVCAKTEDFLYFADINIPSQIDEHLSVLQEKRVIYFLRNVCTQDILSTALASQIDNSKDLLQERINICWLLCELDSVNKKEYENEIRNITQKKKIDSELRIIQENRINVNIEGIRSDLIDAYNGDFMRYKLYQDNSINDILKAIRDKQEKIILYENDSDRVLRKLINNIRDAFVSSNEYGLDGYLSLNIRHGAISDALRTPLSKHGLLAIYDSESNDNILSSQLIRIIKKENDKEKLVEAIKGFTKKTNDIINDLKNKYIRIRKNDSYPEGIFDYNIDEWEYDIIRRKSDEYYEFDELLDDVFELLWNKTEKNLNSMKMLLHNSVADRYKLAFTELQEAIDNLEDKENILVLKSKILEASNDMSNTLNKIEFWFQRSTESKNTDFDLDFVFNLGLETIISMHNEVKFKPIELEHKGVNEKIEGKYLKLYSDIFYNLLDNIYKNAKRKNNCIEFEYLLEEQENRQHILLKNPYDCSGDMEEEERKILELKEILSSRKYLDRIGTEGGTGIPKICKLISVDLKKEMKIDFGFEKDQNYFFIELFIRR